MSRYRLVIWLAAVALSLTACEVGSELTTTTEPPTTTVVLGPAAQARATICEPYLRFVEINPIVGFPERVEATVAEARGLVATLASANPRGISEDYAAWVVVRRHALDAIEDAGFVTSDLDPQDPRFVAVASQATRDIEALLLTYCTAEAVYGDVPWFAVVDPILQPPERVPGVRVENGLEFRSLAENEDVTRTYRDVFGEPESTDDGLVWSGNYADVPHVVVVRNDGLGSLIRITIGDQEG